MITIGKQAPAFSCDAVINKEIKQIGLTDFDGKYKILFFYPLDFTFVCPTELHALQQNLHEFKKRGVDVLAISVDSVHAHLAWLNTPRNRGGIEGVAYPLLADITKSIARDYGVLDEQAGVAFRGTFLLDKNNVMQHASINNLSLGRSIAELLRMVDALMHVEKAGEVCPANWESGQKAMRPTQESLKQYFELNN